jgi:acetylornithine deacetylase/succinyl-diaminopimelate desuccinylase-like protein
MKGVGVAGAVLLAVALQAQSTALLVDVPALARQPDVAQALEAARASEATTLQDQMRVCAVAAPPFRESARAEMMRRELVELGLHNVRIDRVGNVLGERPGTMSRPRLVVASHLDTVFPADTNVKPRREGMRLRGPGIGDNCRGLAVLLAIVRSLNRANVVTPGSITFVANVGEEGLGDLRGVRALFNETLKGEIDRFLSIDGTGVHITNVAVGSLRYRVTFKAPGGHSYGAFGTANPIHALGRAIAKISEFTVPGRPRTTFNVGRIGGGTSINAIAYEAWMEVDMRSSDSSELAALDERFQRAVDAAVAEENRRWGVTAVVAATKERVGERPAGSIAANSPIVQTAMSAGRVLGLSVPLGEGSTDANVPLSLGVPAITIGGGGNGADAHAPEESFDATDSWKGTLHGLLVTVALAQSR